jgi:phage tail-like protein
VAVALRLDPYLGFRFLVEIQGMIVAGFTEVSGLQAEIETFEYREGGLNDYAHQLPGPVRYPNLVLRRGLTDFDNLWSWHRDVTRGKVRRRNGSVILAGDLGHLLWRWNFRGAYPVRWVGPELRAEAATVAVETLELSHQGISKGLFG